MMFCNSCGNEIVGDEKFCTNCGLVYTNLSPSSINSNFANTISDSNVKQKSNNKAGHLNVDELIYIDGASYRSSDNKVIDGVCGGIAHKFGIDASMVRFFFVLFGPYSMFYYIYARQARFPAVPTRNVYRGPIHLRVSGTRFIYNELQAIANGLRQVNKYSDGRLEAELLSLVEKHYLFQKTHEYHLDDYRHLQWTFPIFLGSSSLVIGGKNYCPDEHFLKVIGDYESTDEAADALLDGIKNAVKLLDNKNECMQVIQDKIYLIASVINMLHP